MFKYYIFRVKSVTNTQNFYQILTLMNREDELCRLAKWADKHRYTNPLRLYKTRLTDTEKALFRARIDTPYATRYAHAAFILKKVLFPRLKYYTKGSARAYKHALLTP